MLCNSNITKAEIKTELINTWQFWTSEVLENKNNLKSNRSISSTIQLSFGN